MYTDTQKAQLLENYANGLRDECDRIFDNMVATIDKSPEHYEAWEAKMLQQWELLVNAVEAIEYNREKTC